ncbi:MAG TPA: polymorphic toxin-type HINT domain-containing protein [Polyangia bacterium]
MCFTAGTPVMTSEGPRAIETIRPGTLVLARDQFGGATDWKPVLQTFVSRTQSLIHMEVRQQDGTEDLLEVTPNHPFFVEGRGWIEAGTLVPGQDLLLDYRGQRVDITSATSVAAQVVVYNLEVADYHTYFAGRLGIWAHNVGYQPCNVPPSIQAVMDQTGSGLFFPAYPPLPPSTGSTGSSVGGYLPAPPNWPLSRPPSAVPTPVGTPTASPYLTPFSSPWSSSQYLTAPPSPWSSTSSFGAPPPAPAPAPAPITQLAPGTFLYHATKWESLNNIVAGGLRPVPNAWGGGQLGPGFYTATTAAGAHSYLTEAGGILVYQTIGPTQGPRVDLWQNPLPPGHPAFDQFPFFAGTENPITQYKWNHSAYNRIELVGVKFGPNEDMIPIQDYRDDYLP